MLYNRMEEMIGHTPLIALNRYQEKMKVKAFLFAKLEMFNPCGSAKDRIALKMVEAALKDGKINKDSILVEPTSGNTGIALAALGLAKGIKVMIVMPATMSKERIRLLEAYGAKLVLTDGTLGMQGAIDEAKRFVKNNPNAYLVGQFTNQENVLAHYTTTAPELMADLQGKIDYFVAGIGTGGSITGIGKYLKERLPEIKIIGVEPKDSPLITQNKAGPHQIQGIGANFIPPILDLAIVDEVMTISTQEAYQGVYDFRDSEGLLVGISAGAVIHAATKLSMKEENQGKNIVVLLADGGERYLTTALFRNENEE